MTNDLPKKITPVVQEEKTGCGIAAVATITQQTYASAKSKANALGIFSEDEKLEGNQRVLESRKEASCVILKICNWILF